ncbi:FATTY ACID EXPORT 3 [Spatholobus suberectus]|nr:FATTY ACID EXPORT 3 [Spatholobus suberectus]
MSMRLESVWGLNPNPKVSQPRFSTPNLRSNPHSLFLPPCRILTLRSTAPPSFLALAAPREEGGEIEPENEKNDDRIRAEESWKQALDAFREQASKIREASQEAYELYSEKAILVLKEATEELRVTAKEIGEEGKQYLTVVAENSPEVKEMVETFTSPNHDLSEISKLRDFYVGIPYGLVLSVGGFVSFMVTGSTAALRFGIVLGGVLLALSISSLRSYKRGQPSSIMLKGQTAIASILFLREIRLLAAEVRQFYLFIYFWVCTLYSNLSSKFHISNGFCSCLPSISQGSPLVTYFTALIRFLKTTCCLHEWFFGERLIYEVKPAMMFYRCRMLNITFLCEAYKLR